MNEYSLAAAERAAIIRAMIHAGGVKEKAYRLLGVGRSTLYRKLREHNIVPEEYATGAG